MTADIETDGQEEPPRFSDALKPGTVLLRGQYTITRFLNAGGFGMTYLANDSLERTVVIKECFPSTMCVRDENVVHVRSRTHHKDFATLVTLFGSEARRLAKLQHPNIVGVHQVFEDNDTAYMALDFVRGQDMLTLLNEGRQWDADGIKTLLLKLLDAVSYLHARDILHRDISPDNILIDDHDEPILIDFGAAREEATRASRILSSIHTVKDGYSPHEFYLTGSPQAPSSDLYALAATFYHVITGVSPPDSQSRVAAAAEGRKDPLEALSSHGTGFDHFFVEALNKALAIFPKDRMQSADEWIVAIHTQKRRAAALEEAMHNREVEASIFKLVSETNKAVQEDQIAEDRARSRPLTEDEIAAGHEQAAQAAARQASDQQNAQPHRKKKKRRPKPTVFEEPPTRPEEVASSRAGRGGITGAIWRFVTRNKSRQTARKG